MAVRWRTAIRRVMEAARDDMGVVVKMNMYDGFRSGMQREECLEVARELERLGVHALVLSAGFVSKAPMAVMRGAMPLRTLAHYMSWRKFWWLKALVRGFGRLMIPTVPYKDAYFLDDAKAFRAAVSLPLIYVGGMVSRAGMEEVLAAGFDALQMARALKLQSGEVERSECRHSNYCIGRMYTLQMRCNHCAGELPPSLRREIEKAEERWSR